MKGGPWNIICMHAYDMNVCVVHWLFIHIKRILCNIYKCIDNVNKQQKKTLKGESWNVISIDLLFQRVYIFIYLNIKKKQFLYHDTKK